MTKNERVNVDMTVWKEVGERIDVACEASPLTMAKIAEEVGVSVETLRRWRRGEWFPTRENWESLAAVVKVTVAEMLVEAKPPIITKSASAKSTYPFRGGLSDVIAADREALDKKAKKRSG